MTWIASEKVVFHGRSMSRLLEYFTIEYGQLLHVCLGLSPTNTINLNPGQTGAAVGRQLIQGLQLE